MEAETRIKATAVAAGDADPATIPTGALTRANPNTPLRARAIQGVTFNLHSEAIQHYYDQGTLTREPSPLRPKPTGTSATADVPALLSPLSESTRGVRPAARKRCAQHLTLVEREEISRGLTTNDSMCEIAQRLGRPSMWGHFWGHMQTHSVRCCSIPRRLRIHPASRNRDRLAFRSAEHEEVDLGVELDELAVERRIRLSGDRLVVACMDC